MAWVVAGLPWPEHGGCPLGHLFGCGQAGAPRDILPPRGGGRRPGVDRLAGGLGEQVRPAPRHHLHQVIPSASCQQPAPASQVVGQRMDRGVGGALPVNAQLQAGQRIQPVGVGPVLADQNLRPELCQQRRDDRVEGAQPAGITGPGGQRDIDCKPLRAGPAGLGGQPGEREHLRRVLVHADRQHPRIGPERGLHPVAVGLEAAQQRYARAFGLGTGDQPIFAAAQQRKQASRRTC